MEDNNNINENESVKLGLERSNSLTPDSPNKLQRRSSMKHHRSSIKEPSFGVNFGKEKNSLKRKITWTSEISEEEYPESPASKYRDSKTFYSDTSVIKLLII